EEERAELEANILEAGACRDPLVGWEEANTLLDGHQRLAICTKYEIPYQIVWVRLPNRQAAKEWMIATQLGRRNLTPEQFSYFRGQLYNAAKQAHGGERKGPGSSAHSEHLKKTAEQLAEKHGVSASTIRREGEYAEAVDQVGEACGDQVKKDILAGKS